MYDLPAICKLHLLPSSITNAIWVSPHAHLCFLGLCHRESGKGWSTEAEVKSRGPNAAGRYQHRARILPLCVPVRWAERSPWRKTFCFHSALQCHSSRFEGKIMKSDATVTDTQKKLKVSPLRLLADFECVCRKFSYGYQTFSRGRFSTLLLFTHFHSAK